MVNILRWMIRFHVTRPKAPTTYHKMGEYCLILKLESVQSSVESGVWSLICSFSAC